MIMENKMLKYVKYLIILLVLLSGLHLDFHSKRWARAHLREKPPLTVINGILTLGFTENRGMVFGILNNKMPSFAKILLLGVRVVILIFLAGFIILNRKETFLFLLPFLLFLVGAVGNLIDPFLYGYVVDFIHLQLGKLIDWPFYFNLADAYITIGMFILLINYSSYKKAFK